MRILVFWFVCVTLFSVARADFFAVPQLVSNLFPALNMNIFSTGSGGANCICGESEEVIRKVSGSFTEDFGSCGAQISFIQTKPNNRYNVIIKAGSLCTSYFQIKFVPYNEPPFQQFFILNAKQDAGVNDIPDLYSVSVLFKS